MKDGIREESDAIPLVITNLVTGHVVQEDLDQVCLHFLYSLGDVQRRQHMLARPAILIVLQTQQPFKSFCCQWSMAAVSSTAI